MSRPLRRLRTLLAAAGSPSVPLALGLATGVGFSTLVRPGPGGLEPSLPVDASPLPDWGLAWSDRVVATTDVLTAALEGLVGTLGLLAAGAFLLALGTVATLLTARSSVRRHEVAVRGALGAGPGRLALELARDRLLPLLVVGVGTGILLGAAGGWVVHAAWPLGAGVERAPGSGASAVLGGSVVLACLGFTAFVALLPVRHGVHGLAASLAAGARATSDPREGGLRRIVTVVQLTVSLALLSGALLLVQGVPSLRPATPAAGTDTMLVPLRLADAGGLDRLERSRRLEVLLAGVAALPSVDSGSVASPGAWTAVGPNDFVLARCGNCWRGGLPVPVIGDDARHHVVSPGFFEEAGIRVVEGRAFRPGDRVAAEAVAMVSERFARANFESGRAVGRQIRLGGGSDDWYTVVGVVEDRVGSGLGAGAGSLHDVYLSALQHPPIRAELALRPLAQDAVRVAVELASEEGFVATGEPRSVTELKRRDAAAHAWVAGVALVLALVTLSTGLLGVHRVARVEVGARRRELGVRRALGATEGALTRWVLARTARASLLACLLAVPFAVGLAAALREQLGELPLFDGLLFAGLSAGLLGAALAGSLGPALEAARTPPVEVMRQE